MLYRYISIYRFEIIDIYLNPATHRHTEMFNMQMLIIYLHYRNIRVMPYLRTKMSELEMIDISYRIIPLKKSKTLFKSKSLRH